MRVLYERLFRRLGERLDKEGASAISIVEAGGGFRLHYHDSADTPRSVALAYDELLPFETEVRRYKLLRRHAEDEEDASHLTYRNLLRTLGWELDQLEASTVIVDELADSFLVSFVPAALDSESYPTRRRQLFGPLLVLLEDAVARREKAPHRLARLLDRSGGPSPGADPTAPSLSSSISPHFEGAAGQTDSLSCPFLLRRDTPELVCRPADEQPISLGAPYTAAYCLTARHTICPLFLPGVAHPDLASDAESDTLDDVPSPLVAEEITREPSLPMPATAVAPADRTSPLLPELVPVSRPELPPARHIPGSEHTISTDRRVLSMIDVQHVTYIPSAQGGEVQADIQLGAQKLTTSWLLEGSGALQDLLRPLVVELEQVSFVPTDQGGEIQATLRLGNRSFVSTLPVEGEDGDLKPLLARLHQEVGKAFLQTLQAALHPATDVDEPSSAMPPAPGSPSWPPHPTQAWQP